MKISKIRKLYILKGDRIGEEKKEVINTLICVVITNYLPVNEKNMVKNVN